MKPRTKLPAIALLLSCTPILLNTGAATPWEGSQSIIPNGSDPGDLDVAGSISFGTAANPIFPAARISMGTSNSVYWDLTDPSGAIVWRDNSGQTTPRSKMKLGADNVLTLYKNDGTSGLVLDPTSGSITVGASPVVTTQSMSSVLGGLGLQVSNGNLVIPSTLASTSSTNGAFVVAGGMAAGMDSFINGIRIGTGNGMAAVNNTVIGKNSLLANNTGVGLTAVGSNTLSLNSTGNYNVALGSYALSKNTSGSSNIAVGSYALYNNDSGIANTAIGYGSLVSNISGGHNLGIGGYSLHLNTVGGSNTAIGNSALYSNVSGGGNVAIGSNSLQLNSSGGNNCAVGQYGQYSAISAEMNTSLGAQALFGNVDQSSNTAIGFRSLRHLSVGNNNIAVGVEAGSNQENGANAVSANQSILIGNATKTSVTGAQNSIVIGHGAVGEGSNTTVIGNDATESTHIRGNAVLDSATIHGTVIIAEPQGDISMGIYD